MLREFLLPINLIVAFVLDYYAGPPMPTVAVKFSTRFLFRKQHFSEEYVLDLQQFEKHGILEAALVILRPRFALLDVFHEY